MEGAAEVDLDEYCFVLIGDPQIGMVSNEAPDPSTGKQASRLFPKHLEAYSAEEVYETELEFSKFAVNYVNNMNPKPKFAVVLGDLVNTPPSDDPIENKKQVEDFKKVYSELDPEIKLVCVCGNHDVGNEPNESAMSSYRENFGDDFFSFNVGRDKYLVINSQYYESSKNCTKSAEKHEKWFQEALDDDDFRHKMIFGHIAPFIYEPDEPAEYFNYDLDTRRRVLSKVLEGGVSKWFCGHYHRNAEGVCELNGKKVDLITTAAIGGNVVPNPEGDALAISGVGGLLLKEDVSGIRIVQGNYCWSLILLVNTGGIKHSFSTIKECKQKLA